MARYIIGIDLGTTNVAVAYMDMSTETPEPTIFAIPQVVEAGETDARDTLPSFVYLPDDGQFAAGSLDLPWADERDFAVGQLARKHAATLPGQVVSSAKSWLCAQNVDRLSDILPWNRQRPDKQISPVEAARRILLHLRDAWNHSMLEGDDDNRFEFQELVLTVPASFDAVARDLTVKAAENSGLHVMLLEEPQAAFYAWLHEHENNWREMVDAGERVLVCDIGGGTTDFSLIEVRDDGGNLNLERIAVGNHILLGGDNLDLTLAHTVAAKLRQDRGMTLDQYQLAGLTHACREAKEGLLADPNAEARTLTVLGRGSSVIGGAISVELTREEAQGVIVDGFFPHCELGDRPAEQSRAGLRAFGLSYAADPAITRHLAAFVTRNMADGDASLLPGAVLFNGGVSKADQLRDRVVDVLNTWRGDRGDVRMLTGTHPDLAVATGACWYGHVRKGNAIRIRAGSPRSYYVGIESTMPAVPGFTPPLEGLCVVPFGMEEGTEIDIPFGGLGLLVGENSEFRFFASADRQDDDPGTVVPEVTTEEFSELPVLTTQLSADDESTPAGTLIPVRLHSDLSEIGTLALWCHEDAGQRRWKLHYELRENEDET
jgi:molecular chaperone DnaK (HSP70)